MPRFTAKAGFGVACDINFLFSRGEGQLRLEKGHTEGYEPKLTAHILERMMAAPRP